MSWAALDPLDAYSLGHSVYCYDMTDNKRPVAMESSLKGTSQRTEEDLHFAQRGEAFNDNVASEDISGFDAERMRARSALTSEEERKLLRKIDLRIMSLCSLLFLLKNIDSNNLSNARIMNAGTARNIMTQLNMTSDEYNLLTVLYYVNKPRASISERVIVNDVLGTLHSL